MKENRFIQSREEVWSAFETTLNEYERTKAKTASTVDEFVRLYRSVSHDLSVARTRHYGANLVNRLNALVVRGHNLVYVSRTGWLEKIYHFYVGTFPREVRKHKKWVFVSLVFFAFPWAIVSFGIAQSDSFIYLILDHEMVKNIERMYDPNTPFQSEGPMASSQVRALGGYLFNNTSIGLVVFVSGIGFGLLTIFVLIFNGVFLGSVFAHLSVEGYSSTLYPFVIGHGAFELTAIVIAGAAGLRLAAALFFPGKLGRKTALRLGIQEVMTLVAGFFTMFIIAALIEAFWSPLAIPPIFKYIVGTLLWIFVLGYFFFLGRNEISRFAG